MEKIKNQFSQKIINAIEELELLRKKIIEEINFIKKTQNNILDDDIRIYFLNQINNILLDAAIAYKLSENLTLQKWWEINLPDCPLDIISYRINLFHKGIGINLINSTFSITENAFRKIIRKIKPGACKDGKSAFENIYKCLLKELNTEYNENLFILFRLIRNCQHNNGFYFPENNTESKNVIYRGINYYFPYGEKVIYPKGIPIISILSDITTLFVEMCKSETLKKTVLIHHENGS